MLTPFVKPRQVLSVKVVSNLVLKNCDSSFLDVGIATEFLSVKLGQNGRKTIQSVKVRVHRHNHYRKPTIFEACFQVPDGFALGIFLYRNVTVIYRVVLSYGQNCFIMSIPEAAERREER